MDASAKTVLIVEDNELNMKLFHDLLDAHGYRILQTKDGMEALDIARELQRVHAVARLQGTIAVRVEQIVEELHIELIVLHDQDGLGHLPCLGLAIRNCLAGFVIRHAPREPASRPLLILHRFYAGLEATLLQNA